MLGRSDTFRVAAIIALIAVVVVSLVAIHQRPAPSVIETPSTNPSPASDDLSAELRRCGALGPQDAEDARCGKRPVRVALLKIGGVAKL